MIQKRNISTFAIGLCLLAFMLLSASPAKAFKTTDPQIEHEYNRCLKDKEVKTMKACFKRWRKTHKSACLVEERYIPRLLKGDQVVSDLCRKQ